MNTIKKRESNFTQVSNSFLRDGRISFKAKGLFCYMFSMSESWNFTIRSIAKQQKDGQASIISAMNELKEFGYLNYTKNTDGSGTYYLNDEPNVENPNVGNPNFGKSIPIKNKQLSQNKNTKEAVPNINHLIIDDLNKVLGSSYKYTTQSTNKLIKARLNEGFTLDDFYMVHKSRYEEWANDDKMKKYLRPETLYGTKFESYLNQSITKQSTSQAVQFQLEPNKYYKGNSTPKGTMPDGYMFEEVMADNGNIIGWKIVERR